MAGIAGNAAWFMFQRNGESGKKGKPATVALNEAIKSPYAGGTLGPNREIGQLAETDANRDQGISYVKTSSTKGNPELYVRDQGIVPLLYGVLGGKTQTEASETFKGKVAAGKLSELVWETEPPPLTANGIGFSMVGFELEHANLKPGTTITSYNEATKTFTLSEPATAEIPAAQTITITNAKWTITPANTLPYYTFWTALNPAGAGNAVLFEKHNDCKITDLELKASAGSPLVANLGVMGINSERVQKDPTETIKVPLQNATAYNYNNATVTLGGSATALVGSMTLSISNNATAQQTDDVTLLDVAEGKRSVSIGFDLIFEDLKEYGKFHYGKEASEVTAEKISPNLYTTSMKFEYKLSALNVIEFEVPVFAYEEFPVQPDVNGAPLVVSLKGVAQRSTNSNVITAIVKNQHKAY